jgi:hypothetical protein
MAQPIAATPKPIAYHFCLKRWTASHHGRRTSTSGAATEEWLMTERPMPSAPQQPRQSGRERKRALDAQTALQAR